MPNVSHQSQRLSNERSHLSSDVALELALEDTCRLTDHFPIQGSRDRTIARQLQRHRHSCAELSRLHQLNCQDKFDLIEEMTTERLAASMPIHVLEVAERREHHESPASMPILDGSLRAIRDNDGDDGSTWFVLPTAALDGPAELFFDSINHTNTNDTVSDNGAVSDDNDNDHENDSTLSSDESHFSDGSMSVHDNTSNVQDRPMAARDLRQQLQQAQDQEATNKLAQALSGLWSAISLTRQEAIHSLDAERERNMALEEQAREATDRLERAEVCMAAPTNRCNALEKDYNELSKRGRTTEIGKQGLGEGKCRFQS